ncbi:Predicted flavoprotein CzcO associated with the cation diffusion facilitator CzcD [Luteibacter sp. UNCMF331Sha3.1]|uniref:flavin-containing monooxygenase n=1 Tax=Luteibacter sp. UNCMF331Sha3.1 TaxID=1502760 RepID=UPI0008AC7EA9|nr:NAD(P)/FAD-dependent oxidoreductase [Luteibacter sp. UNCMF331Sha3.1]SEM22022.1 Predicted flavoprotein CzcO associated with the cation diffusion facilitator CzcD [Luteibacter sp. UNCMF331Sha3.1]
MTSDHYDVLIIGAGLSGVGMACRLALACPDKRVALVERRHAMGGTWDLFRYPGVRSDSDMFTFGFGFRPWNELTVLADGPSIRRYVIDTAREFGIDAKIRFGLRTTHASWSSVERRWTLRAEDGAGATHTLTCAFLIGATGYYDYDRGHVPAFPGLASFAGRFVHPQHWPDDLDWRGKRVVVIGSGATAVTLVPALAAEAAHVTMVQRSPGYVLAVPSRDAISETLLRVLPKRIVYALARRRNIFLQRTLYKAAMRWPARVRSVLLGRVRKRLGASGSMADFTPSYAPWTQRMCVLPDGDLFDAMAAGKASIVTGVVESFDAGGVRLASGEAIAADIVVSATGFDLQALGGMTIEVDGRPVPAGRALTYKGVLLDGVPNFAVLFGYINASWTLKVDLAAQYVCRLLIAMEEQGATMAVPRAPRDEALDVCILDALRAGYVERGEAAMPRQGKTGPWRVSHSYERDRRVLLREPIEDSALQLS